MKDHKTCPVLNLHFECRAADKRRQRQHANSPRQEVHEMHILLFCKVSSHVRFTTRVSANSCMYLCRQGVFEQVHDFLLCLCVVPVSLAWGRSRCVACKQVAFNKHVFMCCLYYYLYWPWQSHDARLVVLLPLLSYKIREGDEEATDEDRRRRRR